MGYKVVQMGKQNPGYDLLAQKQGDTLKVEVKGHSGQSSSVFVTQSEWGEYLRTHQRAGECWELWNIENLAQSSGGTPRIKRFRYLPKSALRESGYWIDLKQCSTNFPK